MANLNSKKIQELKSAVDTIFLTHIHPLFFKKRKRKTLIRLLSKT